MGEESQNSKENIWEEVATILEQEYPTRESVLSSLELYGNGQAKATIDNCVVILTNDPFLKGAFRKNEMSGRIEICRNLGWKRNSRYITSVDESFIYWYMEKYYGINHEKRINRAIQIVAEENAYHPIKQMLESLIWDGVPRIARLLPKYLGAEDTFYTVTVVMLLLEAMIHRLYVPGAKFDLMICLVGGQGAGKSSFFRLLCMEDSWFSDDLRRFDDEKVYQKLEDHWLMEISEMLATVNAKSIEEIKAFLSKTADNYRIPYEAHSEDRPRQCVFVGTTNTKQFLPMDKSGNRRFLPILIHAENAEKHILEDEEESREYIKMVWAEAFHLYQQKEKHILKLPAELEKELPNIQEEFTPEDTMEGQILGWLDNCQKEYVCTKMIYREGISSGGNEDSIPQWIVNSINRIMNDLKDSWVKVSSHRFPEYGTQRGWKRIHQVDENGFEKVPEQMKIPFEEK